MKATKKHSSTPKRKPAAPSKTAGNSVALSKNLERLDVIIADINSLFCGLRVSPQEDDRSPEMYVIRAAAAHGDRISGEALDLMNKVRDELKADAAH